MLQKDYYYYAYRQLVEENEFLLVLLLGCIALLLLFIFRNFYNAYKKRQYRKKVTHLSTQFSEIDQKLAEQNSQLESFEVLKQTCIEQQQTIERLQETTDKLQQTYQFDISEKERELELQKELNKHQQLALEKYVDFKTVDVNSTRLGPHFIKNIINHIYQDLETVNTSRKNLIKNPFTGNRRKVTTISIAALKNMFNLLDYNVAAVMKTNVSVEKELKYLKAFMELIRYLKPDTSVTIKTEISKEHQRKLNIKPTLFFPFLENALKHGNLNESNSYISILVAYDELGILRYKVINTCEEISLHSNALSQASPFGLSALEKLVKTYYPEGTLHYKPNPDGLFKSELKIPLNI